MSDGDDDFGGNRKSQYSSTSYNMNSLNYLSRNALEIRIKNVI